MAMMAMMTLMAMMAVVARPVLRRGATDGRWGGGSEMVVVGIRVVRSEMLGVVVVRGVLGVRH